MRCRIRWTFIPATTHVCEDGPLILSALAPPGLHSVQIEDLTEGGGIAIAELALPPALSEDQIRKAVAIIEDWEASSRSACELLARLYPHIQGSMDRPLSRQ